MSEATLDIRATGKRKSAIARVRIKPGTGQIVINGRTMAEYFPREVLHMRIQTPFEVAGALPDTVDIEARIDSDGDAMTREPSEPVAEGQGLAAGSEDVRLVFRVPR